MFSTGAIFSFQIIFHLHLVECRLETLGYERSTVYYKAIVIKLNGTDAGIDVNTYFHYDKRCICKSLTNICTIQ
jgi:hypothetical protein